MSEKKRDLIPFEKILRDLTRWFTGSSVDFLVIGGVAVSLLARPRTTQDIDVLSLLDESQWEGFVKTGSRFGFIPRINDALEFAQKNRILLMRHKKSQLDIDISFGILPFEEESLKRKVIRRIGELNVPLPTPEDLIIMKAMAHRPQDMVDIAVILETCPKSDLKRIRECVREFADVLGKPEILSQLEKVIRERKTRIKNA